MGPRGNSRRARLLSLSATRLVLAGSVALCAILPLAQESNAQVGNLNDLGGSVAVPEGTQLFLEADTVVYDREAARVTAQGGVQIDYGDYQLVARNLVYDQTSQRLVAAGDVELIEPSGNRIYADAVDITDDFANGFIEALRIETPDNTRFAAGRAVRRDGSTTTFERGVYTACETCAENPDRPPLWQVTARRIVWDQENEIVRYYGARFEFFGAPIAYLPYFAAPDSGAQRQSGFLAPEFRSSDKTGFGVRVPYFWAIDDSQDLTVAGTYYNRQGFLLDAEYRRAFENGYFTLQTAGIMQREPEAFDDFLFDGVNPVTPDIPSENRGMVGTTGRFAINENWTVGWDAMFQSDPNFSNVYEIPNFSDVYRSSEIYLTGLGDRSFFDLRAQRFDVQTQNTFTEELQPLVLPTLDYQRISEDPVLGGEVELNVNFANLRREETSPADSLICRGDFLVNGICRGGTVGQIFRDDVFRFRGLEGDYTRATTEATWRSRIVTDQGLVLTPSLGARGDLYTADMQTPAFMSGTTSLGGLTIDDSGARGMVTAGIEASYPWLIETASTSHVIEPIAQLLVRPDEALAGRLPNEDAQSLVFNTSNLFSQDKFSGYDRIEGGTRANVGLKYAGVLGAGYSIDAAVGQSYHLAGENPFSEVNPALVGFDSGLETDRSDYVSSVALNMPIGLSLGAQGRFDRDDLSLERADLTSSLALGALTTSLTYSQIAEQPTYGFAENREQVRVGGRLKLTEEITTFGSINYDVENSSVIARSFGVGYADECFTLLAEYRNTSDRYQLQSAESQVFFRLSLRTLVETEFGTSLSGSDDDTGSSFF